MLPAIRQVVSFVGDTSSLVREVDKAVSTVKGFSAANQIAARETNSSYQILKAQIEGATARLNLAKLAQEEHNQTLSRATVKVGELQRTYESLAATRDRELSAALEADSTEGTQKHLDSARKLYDQMQKTTLAIESQQSKVSQLTALQQKDNAEIDVKEKRISRLNTEMEQYAIKNYTLWDKVRAILPLVGGLAGSTNTVLGGLGNIFNILKGKGDALYDSHSQGMKKLSADSKTAGLSLDQAGTAAAQSQTKFAQMTTGSMALAVALGTSVVQAAASAVQYFIQMGQQSVSLVANVERLSLSLRAMVAQEMASKDSTKTVKEEMGAAAGRAQELLKWIQQLAIKSPFSVEGIQNVFKMVKSFGFASDAAQRITQDLTDWASATGRDEGEMQRIALALSEIQTQGKLSGEQVRMLAMAGIPIQTVLATGFKKTTAEIQQMQEKGLIPANQAIEMLLKSLESDWGGQAAAQAESFSGLLNSLSDLGKQIMRNLFGPIDATTGKVKGLFGAVQPYLSKLVDYLGSGPVVDQITKWGEQLGDLANNALTWGQNIVIQFSNGINAGLSYVFDALGSIGSAITDMLQPGSPPKLLPELDQWGAGAINAYMEGWSKVDQGTFDELTGTLEGYLKSFSDTIVDKLDLNPMLGRMRSMVAQATQEIASTSQVTERTMTGLVDTLGKVGGGVKDYVVAMVDLARANKVVEDAQTALNSVTQKYDEQLAGLNAQLDAITNKQTEKDENNQIAKYNRIINDKYATEARKAQAQGSLDELLLKRKIRMTEAEKKTAESAAQKKLDEAKKEQQAAQQRVDAQKAMIAAQEKTNELLKAQADLLEQAAKAMAKAAGGAGGPKGGGNKPVGGTPGASSWDKRDDNFKRMNEDVEGMNPLKIKLAELKLTFAHLWDSAKAAWQDFWDSTAQLRTDMGDFFKTQMGIVWKQVVQDFGRDAENIRTILENIGKWWGEHRDSVFGIVQFLWTRIVTVVSVAITLLSGAIKLVLDVIAGNWSKFWQDAHDTGKSMMDSILAMFGLSWNELERKWVERAGEITTKLVAWFFDIKTKFSTFVDEAVKKFSEVWTRISAAITGAWETLKGLGKSLIDGITEGVKTAVDNLVKSVIGGVTKAIEGVRTLLHNPHSPSPYTEKVVGEPIMQGIIKGVTNEAPRLKGLLSGLVGMAVTPPATAGQMMSISNSRTVTNNYNYAPTYGSVPQQPTRDFAIMKALAGT